MFDARRGGGAAIAGFDFPIGVPQQYARRAEISSFVATLRMLGSGEWRDFYRVAETSNEITLWRPFYPQRPGGTSQRQLTDGLGVANIQALLRTCDRATDTRRAACSIFWTLGGNQVGKGAISGWRDVLAPALNAGAPPISIWPFDGPLDQLLSTAQLVVAETYPAEFYGHLAITLHGSKRNQEVRQAAASAFRSWRLRHTVIGRVEFSPDAQRAVESGFGALSDGEDQFDAFVGLIGMLNIVLGLRDPGDPVPCSPEALIEGWILGQRPSSSTWMSGPAAE